MQVWFRQGLSGRGALSLFVSPGTSPSRRIIEKKAGCGAQALFFCTVPASCRRGGRSSNSRTPKKGTAFGIPQTMIGLSCQNLRLDPANHKLTRVGIPPPPLPYRCARETTDSRPDRDDHVRIAMDHVMPNARNNFAKATAVNSLGSPYDFGSIMHYPPVSFSKDGRTPTIVPREPLERWEAMGQRAQLSRRDVEQLRLLYQCASGPRAGGAGVDELCSTDCKCWEHAMGECHGDDDECVGDLVCRPTPSLLAKKHEDRLPYYASRGGSFSCDDFCHPDCCHFANGRVRCPETCDSAPPAEAVGEVPTQMCVRQDGGGGATTTTTTTTTSTTTTTTTTTSNPIHPTAPWYVKWGIDK